MSTPVLFQLSEADAAALPRRLKQGHASARSLSRARVLLLAHQGLSPEAVATAVLVSRATVYNVWTRYRADGLEAARAPALGPAAQSHAPCRSRHYPPGLL